MYLSLALLPVILWLMWLEMGAALDASNEVPLPLPPPGPRPGDTGVWAYRGGQQAPSRQRYD
jgi:hypothetical protein